MVKGCRSRWLWVDGQGQFMDSVREGRFLAALSAPNKSHSPQKKIKRVKCHIRMPYLRKQRLKNLSAKSRMTK